MQDPMAGELGSLEGADFGMEEPYDLAQMSEEELQQLVSLGVIDENMAENARQMAMQEGLRYQAAPEGRQAGRTYTAANPMEHAGKLLEQYNAQKKMESLEKERGVMQSDQTTARGNYWDLLRGKRRKPQDFSGVPMPVIEGL